MQQTSMVRPVLGASSSNYSEWYIDDKWSFQVWKSGDMSNTSTVRPVYDKFVIDDDRSFLNRVNDRLRKRQNRSSKDATKDSDKHSVI